VCKRRKLLADALKRCGVEWFRRQRLLGLADLGDQLLGAERLTHD
jgi:hypothetical protein